jgi:hypothetical protein
MFARMLAKPGAGPSKPVRTPATMQPTHAMVWRPDEPTRFPQRALEVTRSSARSLPPAPIPFPDFGLLQRKLSVGRTDDPLEAEADRIAQGVMGTAGDAGKLTSAQPGLSCKCSACEDEQAGSPLRRKPAAAMSATPADEVPELVQRVLSRSGEPLDHGAGRFFEPRFGRDFAHVRVHADPDAARSAEMLSAKAYTVGRHIVFAPGRYAPTSPEGRLLLAHELAHVVQQGGAAARPAASGGREGIRHVKPRVQRACGPAIAATAPDCARDRDPAATDQPAWWFRFNVDCDTLRPGETRRLQIAADRIPAGTLLRVHGYASEDGPAAYNLALSCQRAHRIADTLRMHRDDWSIAPPIMHGEQGDRAHREEFRAVFIERRAPRVIREAEPQGCNHLIGNCDFYLCRERLHPCGPGGYYIGYGHKYCVRFSALAGQLSPAGRSWALGTLRCLQLHLARRVPVGTPCPQVRDSAYASHAGCYVANGICALALTNPQDALRILQTIDWDDLDMLQVLATIGSCPGYVAGAVPLAFPATSLTVGGGFRRMLRHPGMPDPDQPPPRIPQR